MAQSRRLAKTPTLDSPRSDRRFDQPWHRHRGVSTEGARRRSGEQRHVTPEMVQRAEWIAGIEIDEDDRKAVAEAIKGDQQKIDALRKVPIDYDIPPAIPFYAAGPQLAAVSIRRDEVQPLENAAPERPHRRRDLAFLPVTELSALFERKISSVELTKLYLARLKRYNDLLNCVVTLTEDVALEQAQRADREIAAGRYRGPLHGIPWGAKDLIAWPGYKTTWGAGVFKEQTLDVKATVAARLEDAGPCSWPSSRSAHLAMGDEWFGGLTRNPWNPEEGSSGSSAGSASAVAAGLVGFAIGSETLGSIVSPCRRCSVTGLRPDVWPRQPPRLHESILEHGQDRPDRTRVEDCRLCSGPFTGTTAWIPRRSIDHSSGRRGAKSRRCASVTSREAATRRAYRNSQCSASSALSWFRSNCPQVPGRRTDCDTRHRGGGRLRRAHAQGCPRRNRPLGDDVSPRQFIPAVEYLRANRIRTLVMREMEEVMGGIDAYVGGDDLTLTNLTGHPTVVFPTAIAKVQTNSRARSRSPVSYSASRSYWHWRTPISKRPMLISAARRWRSCSMRKQSKPLSPPRGEGRVRGGS